MKTYTPSMNCITLIQHYENCLTPMHKKNGTELCYKAYKDPKGIPTIGWGSIYIWEEKDGKPWVSRRVKMTDIITKTQADTWLNWELRHKANDVNFLLKNGKVELTQSMFDSLVSFAYNIGSDIDEDTKAEGLGDSTLLKMILENPNNIAIQAEFEKWRNKGTSFEWGLWRRRKSEANLYFNNKLFFDWVKPVGL